MPKFPRKVNIVKLQGNRLKEMREAAGLSQDELAKRCGVSLRQMGRYEHNEAEPTAHVLAAIAKTLGCSSDYLLGLVDTPLSIMPDFGPEAKSFWKRFKALPQNIQDFIAIIGDRRLEMWISNNASLTKVLDDLRATPQNKTEAVYPVPPLP